MATEIINLTPHNVVVVGDDGAPLRTFPASGHTVRLSTAVQKHVDTICTNVPVYTPQYFTGVDWPESLTSGITGVIVSMPVGQHCESLAAEKGKYFDFNIYGPDTSPAGAVRNEKGQIVGTKRLVQYV